MKNKITEIQLVKKFTKNMKKKNIIHIFKSEIKILPNIIDYSYLDINDKNLIGVEFKLYNWKKAIEQAFLINDYFNLTYICILKPAKNSTMIKILEMAIFRNIGIITFDLNKNEFIFETIPKKNNRIININVSKNRTLHQKLYYRYNREMELVKNER